MGIRPMTPRKKLLFITDAAPLPLDRGQRIRIRSLLAACSAVADVALIAQKPAAAADRQTIEAEFPRVIWIGDDATPGGWQGVKRLVETGLASIGLPSPGKIAHYLPYMNALKAAGPASFDLIWAERPHIARLCRSFAGKTIVDLDDLEHLKIAHQLNIAKTPLAWIKHFYRYWLYRRVETVWTRRFFASVVCSQKDRAYLRRHGGGDALVVPNASDLATTAERQPRAEAAPLRLVFLGNLDYPPNADALEYFIADIFSALVQARSEVQLDVIGPNPQGAGAAKLPRNVRLRGFVDDLGAALAQYDMMVAPLRVGAGTKLKVLDALKVGLPVVATSIGAEGLELTHGKDLWIADTASGLIEGILRLKRDPELAEKMAANAKEHVAERFSWPAIEARLATWLAQAQPPRS
jgi:glycosyltransferase involved in cell wall biosynthesis